MKSAEEMLAELDDLLRNTGPKCRSYVIEEDKLTKRVRTYDCERLADHAGRFHQFDDGTKVIKWTQV